MFCLKCGGENAEKSTFCTWCGAKLDIGASSVPTPSVIPQSDLHEQPIQTAVLPEEISSPLHSEEAPAVNTDPAPEQPSEPVNTVPLPQPEPPEQPELPKAEEQPTKNVGWNSEIPLSARASENPEADGKPRKYYTGAHLAICLAVTGIMAAAAGIFAGLYFSVIL